ncbi:MAG: YggS family pyridoxal phosphate-dependent enzyme [Puniceicoccales bacterium]|jgi:pyridoxal phosphate enzyme (YggS family)|nr:YggS family pyridoxal phosphate-dependent enzyme [Puniceicoccales bacterium]
MLDNSIFLKNLAAVRTRIADACAACGREPRSVALLPVTKTHPADAAQFAYEAGLGAVGENRVQEAAEKRPLAPAGLRWELIGHLQSNKIKQAVATFDRIQSVDTPELATRLGRHCAEIGKTLPVLLQANASSDPAKFGAVGLDDLLRLVETAAAQPALHIEGLMTIPALDASPDVARRAFETLREWRGVLETRLGRTLPELSMGMSGDLEIAIAAGSTLVRVGTALFGHR